MSVVGSTLSKIGSGIVSTITTVGKIASVAAPFIKLGGQVVTAFGERGEAEIVAGAEEFAAGADIFNAGAARAEGRLAQAAAKLNIRRRRTRAMSLISTQEALFAKSGVRFEGSPLLVMEDSLAEAELDILIEQFNADVIQQRKESEAVQAEITAAQKRGVAGQVRTAGRLQAGRTILTSALDLLSKFKTTEDTTGDTGGGGLGLAEAGAETGAFKLT